MIGCLSGVLDTAIENDQKPDVAMYILHTEWVKCGDKQVQIRRVWKY